MDINRLCPGCMREVGMEMHKAIQGAKTQDAGMREEDISSAEAWKEARHVKMQITGIQADGAARHTERAGMEQNRHRCPYCGYNPDTYRHNARYLPIHTILAGKYLVGAVLGEGGFGITYIGYDLNMQTRIAIKEYFPVELVSRDTTSMTGDRVISLSGDKSATYKQGLKKYVTEAQNVSQFSEIPGVVSVKDFFYENETAYIVMEYIDGISLKDYLKERGGRLSEEESLAIMKPVLEALVKVHEAGITHRDISPDNIMLSFENGSIASVKLIDFGAARMTARNDQKSLTIILKHGYAPEEQYRTHGEQGAWTDVYAVCAVLYRMLTGETPVPAMDRMFQDGLKSFDDLNTKVSRNTQAAILKGLAVKKEDRIQTVTELIQALYEGKSVRSASMWKKRNAKILAATGAAMGLLALLAAGTFIFMRKEASNQTLPQQELAETVSEKSQAEVEESIQGDGDDKAPESGTLVIQEQDTPELGPQIVWSKPETLIAAGDAHILSIREDGTVLAAGRNTEGQCDVEQWENIAAVYAYWNTSAGLTTDGKVYTAGNYLPQEWTETWEGIISLAVGEHHIIGLHEDGTVVSAGDNEEGQCDTGDWTEIESVWAEGGLSIGITKTGEVRTAGSWWDEAVLDDIRQWTDIRQIARDRDTFYGLKRDGTVICSEPEAADAVADWTGITAIVAGDLYEAGLCEDGKVIVKGRGFEEEVGAWTEMAALAATDNNLVGLGQDGLIRIAGVDETEDEALEEILSLENAVQAAWGNNFMAVLCDDGTVKYAGYSPYTHKRQLEDLDSWTDITKIEAIYGDRFAGITSDGRIRITDIGSSTMDYDVLEGRSWEEAMAENDRRQALTPDLVSTWEGVKDISCSGDHIVALMGDGTVKAAGYVFNQSGTDYETGLTKDGACETGDFSEIKQIAAISGRTVGLREDGTLMVAGEMMEGLESYAGLSSIWKGIYDEQIRALAAITEDGTAEHLWGGDNEKGQQNTAGWSDLVQLALSDGHTVGLKSEGTVVAVGSNYCGQCEVEGWTDVVSISAGPSSTMGITSDGRVLMAGTLANDYYSAMKWPAVSIESMLKGSP